MSRYESPQRRGRPAQAALETAAAADGNPGMDTSLMEELGGGEMVDDFYSGVFEDPTLSN